MLILSVFTPSYNEKSDCKALYFYARTNQWAGLLPCKRLTGYKGVTRWVAVRRKVLVQTISTSFEEL